MKKILRYKNTILAASSLIVVISITIVAVFGFKLGIDFTSGSLWQVKIPNAQVSDIRDFFSNETGIDQLNISFDDESQIYALSFREISEHERQSYLELMSQRFGDGVESVDFLTISPSVSLELRNKSMWAIGLVLLGISLYIAFAFRKVSEPIKSWKYGVITLITLAHDAAIPAAVFALLGKFNGVVIDTNFVVAMLFVMGFSVHDTIVVFDRIRENLLILKERAVRKVNLEEVVDKSIMETLARSINTSLTLIVILVALLLWGPVSTKMFILAILIGTVAGTYSSIFFASPLLVFAQRFSKKQKEFSN